MKAKLVSVPVSVGRVSGIFMSPAKRDLAKPILVLFNQWRSGSRFMISQYLTDMLITEGIYDGVLFLDRLASAGESDEHLSKQEIKAMRIQGDFQFGELYAQALKTAFRELGLPEQYVLGGSSAGGPAALACVNGMSRSQRKHVRAIILVEPGGIKKYVGGMPSALGRHVVAYRHRVSRGWWTPLDKEQYFHRKGKLFEYRGRWWAKNYVYHELLRDLSDTNFPPIRIILSKNSHINTKSIRAALKTAAKKPHRYIEITGNHDKLCQPPSLSKLYSKYL